MLAVAHSPCVSCRLWRLTIFCQLHGAGCCQGPGMCMPSRQACVRRRGRPGGIRPAPRVLSLRRIPLEDSHHRTGTRTQTRTPMLRSDPANTKFPGLTPMYLPAGASIRCRLRLSPSTRSGVRHDMQDRARQAHVLTRGPVLQPHLATGTRSVQTKCAVLIARSCSHEFTVAAADICNPRAVVQRVQKLHHSWPRLVPAVAKHRTRRTGHVRPPNAQKRPRSIHARERTGHGASGPQTHFGEVTPRAVPRVAEVGGDGVVHAMHVLLLKQLRILLPQSPADSPRSTRFQRGRACNLWLAQSRAHAARRPAARGRRRARDPPDRLPARRDQTAGAAGHCGGGDGGTRRAAEPQEHAAQRAQQRPLPRNLAVPPAAGPPFLPSLFAIARTASAAMSNNGAAGRAASRIEAEDAEAVHNALRRLGMIGSRVRARAHGRTDARRGAAAQYVCALCTGMEQTARGRRVKSFVDELRAVLLPATVPLAHA